MKEKIIDFLIRKEWEKKCETPSDAHFRAQRLTRLQKIKEDAR